MGNQWQQRLRKVVSSSVLDEVLRADIVKNEVSTHDKLKSYIDTKPKDDPWSPYATRSVAAGANGNRHK